MLSVVVDGRILGTTRQSPLGGGVVVLKREKRGRVAVLGWNDVLRPGLAAVLAAGGFQVDTPSDLSVWIDGGDDQVVVVALDGDHRRAERAIQTASDTRVPVVAIADTEDDVILSEVLDQGAQALVLPNADATTCVQAVRTVRAGYSVLPQSVVDQLASRDKRGARSIQLSDEEIAILATLMAGGTTSEIASRIGWSIRTTYRRLGQLYAHLGIAGRAQAVAIAADLGVPGAGRDVNATHG